jgi:glycerol-3-phosphate acyltransferase PlsY
MKLVLGALISYIVGSIPFGLLFAWAKGVDLRKVGSGNIGATNVLRGVGKKAAFFTLLGDALKGAAGVLIAKLTGLDVVAQGLMGLAAILGHDFSLFLLFKGGKGVATSLGMIFVYSPLSGLITGLLWLLTALLKKYSSLSALVAFGFLPFTLYVVERDPMMALFGLFITVLIMIKHTGNIKRLLKGEERKIGEKA